MSRGLPSLVAAIGQRGLGEHGDRSFALAFFARGARSWAGVTAGRLRFAEDAASGAGATLPNFRAPAVYRLLAAGPPPRAGDVQ